jgi:heme-degrading monooxygenase HmoA
MYARHTLFKASPEKRKAIEAMADEIYAFTKSLDGFVSATYLISEDESEYGSVTLWSSREDAEAGGAAILETFRETMAEVMDAPPEVNLFAVYRPTS